MGSEDQKVRILTVCAVHNPSHGFGGSIDDLPNPERALPVWLEQLPELRLGQGLELLEQLVWIGKVGLRGSEIGLPENQHMLQDQLRVEKLGKK
jgi:hypothetical protein